jgi:hypothetical protein
MPLFLNHTTLSKTTLCIKRLNTDRLYGTTKASQRI